MNRSDKYENVRSVYRLLKEKGDIEKLKSHVRQRLILGFASLESTVTKYDDRNTDQTIKLANCIIVDHMKVQECDYSLSVFLPEVGLTDYETEEYVRNFLSSNVRSGCAVWDKMISFRQESNSFLVSILKALSDVSGILSEKKSTQTFDVDCCELDQKLNDINKEYEAIRSSEILHTKKIFEERLQHYKYEISEQYQLKLTQQMHEFRQNEMNTMKLKMEEEFQKRLDEHVKRLEQEFENRLQSLNEQEKLLKEKYSLSQQKEEREAFIKRQALQAELDAVQLMKAQLNQERIQIEREKIQLQKDWEKYELESKKHESLLQIREKTLENEIHEHVDRIRMEDEIKLLKQHKEIELQSVQLSENQKILEEKLKTFEQLKQDLIKQQNKFTEMEIFDYNTIKTQNEVFKNEITSLQNQLKSTIIELEEQKQITASRTTELSVFNVVKQEIERLTNTLNNDRASFIQEKITLQKKLNEQQTEIHKLMERLALYEGQVIHSTEYYRNNCIDNSSIHPPRKTYQDFNKVDQLTEAERRSIYEECNLSISSDLSNKSLMTEKKVTKLSNTIPIQLSDEWSKRLELSRRRIAQLQLVSEQFDSIYEEWKSVDLRQFLSKLHSDLPNVLHNINLDGFINCNEIALHNPFIMNKDDNQLDDIMPPMYHVDDSKSMQLNHQHCKESPASGTQEDGNKPLFIETNPESRRNDNAELQNIHDVKDQSYASSLHDSTYGSDINTPKSNHLSDLQRSSNEGLNIVSKTSAVSGFNHLQSDCPNYSTEYLNHIRPDFIQSTESISQSQSVQSLPLRNSQSTSLKSGTTNCKVSPRSHKKDQRMRAINVEHSDNEMEENEISNQISSGKKDVNNELKNNKAESIEDGFPLLLKTPRTDRTEGETASLTESIDILNGKCSPRNDTVEVKRSSTEGKTQTIGLSLSNIHQNGHNADCDIMEKYLRLSLDNQSKPLVSTNNQTNTIQPIMTNGLHSPSPKNIRTWVESNYHFSSSESDISFKKRDLSSLEKFIDKKPIQNADEIDSGSDYVW